MNKAIIIGVISLPDLTFSSTSGANVRTNVLFLEKKNSPEEDQANDIFMAICDKMGYDTTGKPIEENDLPLIAAEFLKWEDSNG